MVITITKYVDTDGVGEWHIYMDMDVDGNILTIKIASFGADKDAANKMLDQITNGQPIIK